MMSNPEMYRKYNFLPKRDAPEILKKFENRMNWKKSGNCVVDVGSGDGSVTAEILRPYLPNNFEKLIGCDISEVMLLYANKHFGDERTKFVQQDILSELSEELKESFHQAFSIYAFHFFKRLDLFTTAFTNMYNLLTVGGTTLVFFLQSSPIFAVYSELSRTDKWSRYFKDTEMFVPLFQTSQEPVKELTQVVKDIGFREFEVLCEEKTYVFEKEEYFRNIMLAVDPFNIPEQIHKEFMDDFMQTAISTKRVELVTNRAGYHDGVRMNYGLLIFFGTK